MPCHMINRMRRRDDNNVGASAFTSENSGGRILEHEAVARIKPKPLSAKAITFWVWLAAYDILGRDEHFRQRNSNSLKAQ